MREKILLLVDDQANARNAIRSLIHTIDDSLFIIPATSLEEATRLIQEAVSVKIDVAINGFRPMQLVCPSRAC